MMDSDLSSESVWTTPFLQNILHAWPFIVGLLISILTLPRFVLKFWLTVRELDELTLARDSQGVVSENPQTHSESAALKDSSAFIFAFFEPGIIPTWRVNSFMTLMLLLWAYFEQPKLSFSLLYSMALAVGMMNVIFRNLGYTIGIQNAFVMRMKEDRAWVIYSETKARPILIALAAGISLGAFLLRSKVLGAICIPFIVGKMTMDMTFRKRSIRRSIENLLIFWGSVLLIMAVLLLPTYFNNSQERRGDNSAEEKLEGRFLAEAHFSNETISLGALWVLVLEIMSICYRFDYQQKVDNVTANEAIRLSSEFPGNILRLSFISKTSYPNISKLNSREMPEGLGLAGALPLVTAPMIFSTYYLTTLAVWAFSWMVTLWFYTVDDEERDEGLGLCFICLYITSLVMPIAVFAVAWFRGEWGTLYGYEEKWVGGDSQGRKKVPEEN